MLVKSELGRAELVARQRGLGLRERSILLLADGTFSDEALCEMYDGMGRAIVAQLVQEGYLEWRPEHSTALTGREMAQA